MKHFYSLAAWERYHHLSQLEIGYPIDHPPAEPRIRLSEISPDVEMDDALITFWNGERFVNFKYWPPYQVIDENYVPHRDPLDQAKILRAVCGETPVELRWVQGEKSGDHFEMWAGVPLVRRKDFASPWPGHARRCAEEWYGKASAGWQGSTPPGKSKPKPKKERKDRQLP